MSSQHTLACLHTLWKQITMTLFEMSFTIVLCAKTKIKYENEYLFAFTVQELGTRSVDKSILGVTLHLVQVYNNKQELGINI